MANQTSQSELILLGLSDLSYFQIPIILVMLLIYMATLIGNLLIIFLVVSDSHLQTPMYFFLGNLSVLDIFSSSISISHVSFDVFTGNHIILQSTCVTQVFLYLWFAGVETLLLEIMSFDRYIAICHPLRYTTMISLQLCFQLALFFWDLCFIISLIHTFLALRLDFPNPTTIPGLFCELFELIQLSCSDTFLNKLVLNIQALSFGVAGFFITFLSYVYIFKAILKIKAKERIHKAYSTCSSHLTVVFIFYGTACFNYINPKANSFPLGRLLSVFYAVCTPLLNPIIYSLRNSDLKKALWRSLK